MASPRPPAAAATAQSPVQDEMPSPGAPSPQQSAQASRASMPPAEEPALQRSQSVPPPSAPSSAASAADSSDSSYSILVHGTMKAIAGAPRGSIFAQSPSQTAARAAASAAANTAAATAAAAAPALPPLRWTKRPVQLLPGTSGSSGGSSRASASDVFDSMKGATLTTVTSGLRPMRSAYDTDPHAASTTAASSPESSTEGPTDSNTRLFLIGGQRLAPEVELGLEADRIRVYVCNMNQEMAEAGSRPTSAEGAGAEHNLAAVVSAAAEPASSLWQELECTGDVPRARFGHSATFVPPASIFVYGGFAAAPQLAPAAAVPIPSLPGGGAVIVPNPYNPAPRARALATQVTFGEAFMLDCNTLVWTRVATPSNSGTTAGPTHHGTPGRRAYHSCVYYLNHRCVDSNKPTSPPSPASAAAAAAYDASTRNATSPKLSPSAPNKPANIYRAPAPVPQLLLFGGCRVRDSSLSSAAASSSTGSTTTGDDDPTSDENEFPLEYLKDLHIFDLRLMKWTPRVRCSGNPPQERAQHTAAIVSQLNRRGTPAASGAQASLPLGLSSRMLIYSGCNASHLVCTMYSLDLWTFTWTQVSPDGEITPRLQIKDVHLMQNIGVASGQALRNSREWVARMLQTKREGFILHLPEPAPPPAMHKHSSASAHPPVHIPAPPTPYLLLLGDNESSGTRPPLLNSSARPVSLYMFNTATGYWSSLVVSAQLRRTPTDSPFVLIDKDTSSIPCFRNHKPCALMQAPGPDEHSPPRTLVALMTRSALYTIDLTDLRVEHLSNRRTSTDAALMGSLRNPLSAPSTRRVEAAKSQLSAALGRPDWETFSVRTRAKTVEDASARSSKSFVGLGAKGLGAGAGGVASASGSPTITGFSGPVRAQSDPPENTTAGAAAAPSAVSASVPPAPALKLSEAARCFTHYFGVPDDIRSVLDEIFDCPLCGIRRLQYNISGTSTRSVQWEIINLLPQSLGGRSDSFENQLPCCISCYRPNQRTPLLDDILTAEPDRVPPILELLRDRNAGLRGLGSLEAVAAKCLPKGEEVGSYMKTLLRNHEQAEANAAASAAAAATKAAAAAAAAAAANCACPPASSKHSKSKPAASSLKLGAAALKSGSFAQQQQQQQPRSGASGGSVGSAGSKSSSKAPMLRAHSTPQDEAYHNAYASSGASAGESTEEGESTSDGGESSDDSAYDSDSEGPADVRPKPAVVGPSVAAKSSKHPKSKPADPRAVALRNKNNDTALDDDSNTTSAGGIGGAHSNSDEEGDAAQMRNTDKIASRALTSKIPLPAKGKSAAPTPKMVHPPPALAAGDDDDSDAEEQRVVGQVIPASSSIDVHSEFPTPALSMFVSTASASAPPPSHPPHGHTSHSYSYGHITPTPSQLSLEHASSTSSAKSITPSSSGSATPTTSGSKSPRSSSSGSSRPQVTRAASSRDKKALHVASDPDLFGSLPSVDPRHLTPASAAVMSPSMSKMRVLPADAQRVAGKQQPFDPKRLGPGAHSDALPPPAFKMPNSNQNAANSLRPPVIGASKLRRSSSEPDSASGVLPPDLFGNMPMHVHSSRQTSLSATPEPIPAALTLSTHPSMAGDHAAPAPASSKMGSLPFAHNAANSLLPFESHSASASMSSSSSSGLHTPLSSRLDLVVESDRAALDADSPIDHDDEGVVPIPTFPVGRPAGNRYKHMPSIEFNRLLHPNERLWRNLMAQIQSVQRVDASALPPARPKTSKAAASPQKMPIIPKAAAAHADARPKVKRAVSASHAIAGASSPVVSASSPLVSQTAAPSAMSSPLSFQPRHAHHQSIPGSPSPISGALPSSGMGSPLTTIPSSRETSGSSAASFPPSASASWAGPAAWSTQDVLSFLSGLGASFDNYTKSFRELGVDGRQLILLDDEDLKELGVVSRLHRKTILQAITEAQTNANAQAVRERSFSGASASSGLGATSPQSGRSNLGLSPSPSPTSAATAAQAESDTPEISTSSAMPSGINIIRASTLSNIQRLGAGNFGITYRAQWRESKPSAPGVAPRLLDVVVKVPRSKSGADEWNELLAFLEVPSHRHVLPLIGICTDWTITEDAATTPGGAAATPNAAGAAGAGAGKKASQGQTCCFVTLFMTRGSLKDILASDSLSSQLLGGDILDPDLHGLGERDPSDAGRKWARILLSATRILLHIAEGLNHLHSYHILHRDIATRNILVNARNEALISDFGLSRKIQAGPSSTEGITDAGSMHHDTGMEVAGASGGYYRLAQPEQTALPLRWMSAESLCEYLFTKASDCWMWGVCAWELLTRAQKVPYHDLSTYNQLMAKVGGGSRTLTLPAYVPPRLAKLVSSCWEYEMASRPSMAEIVTELRQILAEGEALRIQIERERRAAAGADSDSLGEAQHMPEEGGYVRMHSSASMQTPRSVQSQSTNEATSPHHTSDRAVSPMPTLSVSTALVSAVPASRPVTTRLAGERDLGDNRTMAFGSVTVTQSTPAADGQSLFVDSHTMHSQVTGRKATAGAAGGVMSKAISHTHELSQLATPTMGGAAKPNAAPFAAHDNDAAPRPFTKTAAPSPSQQRSSAASKGVSAASVAPAFPFSPMSNQGYASGPPVMSQSGYSPQRPEDFIAAVTTPPALNMMSQQGYMPSQQGYPAMMSQQGYPASSFSSQQGYGSQSGYPSMMSQQGYPAASANPHLLQQHVHHRLASVQAGTPSQPQRVHYSESFDSARSYDVMSAQNLQAAGAHQLFQAASLASPHSNGLLRAAAAAPFSRFQSQPQQQQQQHHSHQSMPPSHPDFLGLPSLDDDDGGQGSGDDYVLDPPLNAAKAKHSQQQSQQSRSDAEPGQRWQAQVDQMQSRATVLAGQLHASQQQATPSPTSRPPLSPAELEWKRQTDQDSDIAPSIVLAEEADAALSQQRSPQRVSAASSAFSAVPAAATHVHALMTGASLPLPQHSDVSSK